MTELTKGVSAGSTESGVVAERVFDGLQEVLDRIETARVQSAPSAGPLSNPGWAAPSCNIDVQTQPSTVGHPNPVPTVFELASVAACRPASAVEGLEPALPQGGALREVFRGLVKLLPVGASLQVDHWLSGDGTGIQSLMTWVSVHGEDKSLQGAGLVEALEACLAGTADTFAFRVVRVGKSGPESASRRLAWRVRPLGLSLVPGGGRGIGFAAMPMVAGPAIVFSRPLAAGLSSEVWSPRWADALRHGFRQVRAVRRDLHVRLRLRRERLAADEFVLLSQLHSQPPGCEDAASDEGPEGHRAAHALDIRGLAGAWLASAPDAFRLELEADGLDGPLNEVVLGSIAREVFPGLEVEVVPLCDQSCAAIRTPGDLRDVFPLAAGVPPLLPDPALLDSLDFPRHYDNPAVALNGSGMPIGVAAANGFERPLFLGEDSLARHTYIVGGTGAGKTTMLYRRMRYHIDAGHGLIVQEPHGDCIEQLCAHGVPASRRDDVFIIDPSDPDAPVGLNFLDFGSTPQPVQVNRVINDMLDVIDETYNMSLAGGPSFELFFRNIFLLASTAPHNLAGFPPGPPTLITVVAMLSNSELRDKLLSQVRSSYLGDELGGEVERFFENAKRQSGDHSFPNFATYVSSKLTRFISNPRMRNLFCRPYRTVDVREIMDRQGILLVRLDKGVLGEQDTRFLGKLISKLVFNAALSRADLPKEQRTPCHYIIDECHNFICRDMPAMLSEVRKYGLSVCLAHQSLHQLDDGRLADGAMLNSILANCGTKIAMRLALDDAEKLAPLFHPRFDAHSLARLPNFTAIGQFATGERIASAIAFDTLPPEIPGCSGMVMACAEELRRCSNHRHAQKAIPPVVPSGKAPKSPKEKRPDNAGTVRSTRKVVLGDLLSVIVGDGEELDKAKALDTTTKEALLRWRNGERGSVVETVSPELDAGYLTENGSTVFVIGLVDGQCHALVLSGGHGDRHLRGTNPGEVYRISADGKYGTPERRALHGLLGMDLVRRLDIALEGSLGDVSVDETGVWLAAPRVVPTLPLQDGFYRTQNDSVVFITTQGGSWRATVCAGGHAVGQLQGEKVGESYRLDDSGRVEIGAAKTDGVSTIMLGRLSGMSLAKKLSLQGTDVPSSLSLAPSPVPKRKLRGRSPSRCKEGA